MLAPEVPTLESGTTRLVNGISSLQLHPRYGDVFDIVKEIIQLEAQLNEKRAKLESILTGFTEPRPQPPKAEPNERVLPKLEESALKGQLKYRIMKLMSDGIERKSSVIVSELGLENSKLAYDVLSTLVSEGRLVKTRYAHYRLKQRRK